MITKNSQENRVYILDSYNEKYYEKIIEDITSRMKSGSFTKHDIELYKEAKSKLQNKEKNMSLKLAANI